MAKIGCAKCGGTKKMALGGSAVKKAPVQLYGIPQQNMGTSSQMGFGKKGGTLDTMARGGTKKSTASKAAQAASRKVLAAKALAAKTAGANKANAGKIAVKTIAQLKALDAAKKVVTPKVVTPRTRGGVSKGNTPGVGNKYANKPTVKPMLGPDTRKKTIIKNAEKISTKTKDATKEAAKTFKQGRKMNQSVLTAERYKNAGKKVDGLSSDFISKMKKYIPGGKPKMKLGKKALIGTGIAVIGTAATAMLSKKSSDKPSTTKPKVTPKLVAKSSGSTKKDTKVTIKPVVKPVASTKVDTNKNGTKTTTYTDASGIKHVKVTTKDGKTFTSNNKPKDAVVTPPKDTKTTKPVVKTKIKKTEVKTPETTATPTTSTPKVADEVTKMETKRPSTVVKKDGTTFTSIETKNPADLKIIEPAKKTSNTPSSSTSTTVPRANLINKIRSSINASRERRAERAETRGDIEKATKLRDKEKATQAKMMKKGGSVKSFPDLNKDGKVTKADILKGRGVIKKKGGIVKAKKKK